MIYTNFLSFAHSSAVLMIREQQNLERRQKLKVAGHCAQRYLTDFDVNQRFQGFL